MSEAFALGVRPPSDMSPPDWMTANVKLANSERSNKFDIDQTNWLRKPLMALTDPNIKQVVFYAPTGCGKSTMAEGLIPWVVSERPGPFLYMSQTNATSKTWKETRLDFALKSCGYVRKLFPRDRHKSRVADIIFSHMPLHIRGANMANCQELSMQYLYADELWRWDKSLLREFLGRHHNRWNRKVYLVSQAGVVDDAMDMSYEETNKCEWSFECECGEWVRYARELVKFDKIKTDGELDFQKTADTARLVCPHCEIEYKDTARVRRKLHSKSDYIASSDSSLNGHVGYRMHRLGVWWIPWSEYVLTQLKAKKQLDLGVVDLWRQTHQKDDCIPWKDDLGIEKKELRVGYEAINDRDPKERIEDETARFFTCDKGGDHYWGVIRAWSAGKASELLWEGYIQARQDESGIIELAEKYDIEPNHIFIDIGFEWSETVEMCAKNGWWGIRGNGQVQSFTHPINSGGREERLYSQVKYASGDSGSIGRYIEIATDPIKDVLWRLMNGNGLDWSIAPDVSKSYRNHMRSEVRREGPKGKSKNIVGYWEQTKRANHLWDAETYNVAVALVYGIFGD